MILSVEKGMKLIWLWNVTSFGLVRLQGEPLLFLQLVNGCIDERAISNDWYCCCDQTTSR